MNNVTKAYWINWTIWGAALVLGAPTSVVGSCAVAAVILGYRMHKT